MRLVYTNTKYYVCILHVHKRTTNHPVFLFCHTAAAHPQDKTFGLKNKKGAKNQKFIAQVEKQVKSGGLHPLGPSNAKKEEKEKKLKEQKEMAALFRPVQTQKVEKGTDPKSVVCAFFKAGQCGKGDKCKFSHDLTVERKVEKRSLYVDMRDDEGDTMDTWNDEKLQEVVNQKHGAEKRMPTTDIVSIYGVVQDEYCSYCVYFSRDFLFLIVTYGHLSWT